MKSNQETEGARKTDDPFSGTDSLSKALRRNLSFGRIRLLLARARNTLKSRGPEALWREVDFRLRLAVKGETWRHWADIPLHRELNAQRRQVLERMPLLSVVVPLYNTPVKYLRQMVESVRGQSYENWELILVDASDPEHAETSRAAAGWAKKDARIRLLRLAQNGGIAANTNIGLAESGGEYILLLDHDDTLSRGALYEVAAEVNRSGAELIYSDEVVLDSALKRLHEFHFKPDFSPDTLRGCNYITHLCAFSRALLERAGGGEREAFDGAQDYDLILRLSERARGIAHIPKVLYYWRRHAGSTASGIEVKTGALEAGAAALNEHLGRAGLAGQAAPLPDHPGAYRVRYSVQGDPLVSVVIPSKDHVEDLRRCLDSLYEKAGDIRFEVVVVENNSEEAATFAFYKEAGKRYPHLRVVRHEGGFNFAALCNLGVGHATGEHVLLLNNDIEVIGAGFLAELAAFSGRADVGAVGPMLYYPDDTVQHAGLFIGIGGSAGVSHKGHDRGDGGDMFRLCTAQNVSAVTGAALMVKRALYKELGGMDEQRFAVAFNDVDLCLRLREKGYLNVFTPFATAYHYESKSRGFDEVDGRANARFEAERNALRERHSGYFTGGDPYYNPHLTLKTENYAYR